MDGSDKETHLSELEMASMKILYTYKIKTFLNRATPSDSMSYSLKTSVFDVIPNGRSSIPWAAFSYC
jgi:hypothetical protein